MEGKRHWLGWIAIGMSGLALLATLAGGGFGPQRAAAALGGSNAPQPYAQQGAGQRGSGPQNTQAAPGADARQGAAPQNAPVAPGANTQQGAGQPGSGLQNGRARGGNDMRPGAGRPGNSGFGIGGWLRLPFALIGRSFQIGMLALLVLLGLWLLRRRPAAASASSARAEPAQGQPPQPQSPTGEAYIDEPDNPE